VAEPPALSERLHTWLNVRAGEGRRVALMVVYSAATMGGVLTVGLAASTSLFMAELPATAVPFAFILPAFSILPAMLLYNRLGSRVSTFRLISGSNVLLLAAVLGFRLLLEFPAGRSFPVLAGLFLYVELAYTLTIMQFWAVAGQLFNARQARRLFGLIAIGGTLSNVLAGLVLAGVARVAGVENLLLIVAASLAIALACVSALARMAGLAPAAPPPARATATAGLAPAFRRDLQAVLRSPLLRLIAALTIVLSLLINIGAYQFYLALQTAYSGRGAEMAAFLGGYSFFTGLAAVFVQGYLSSRLLGRLGAFVGLLLYPGGVLLGALLALATGGWLGAVAVVRGADPVFRRTIHTAAFNVLYLPIPAALRERGRELNEALYALSFGLLGFLFLADQQLGALGYLGWSIPTLALVGVWAALLPRLRRHYTEALADSLRQRAIDLDTASLSLADDAALEALGRALDGADERLILHGLQLAAGARANAGWNARLAGLLSHPSPAVRAACLQRLGQAGAVEHLERVAALCAAPEPEVRAAAVEAYGALRGEECAAGLLPLLGDAHPRVRGAAIAGLLQWGPEAASGQTLAALDAMLTDPNPAVRAEAARAAGAAGAGPASDALAKRLLPVLAEPDASPQVLIAAAEAAGRLADPALMAHVVPLLGSHRVGAAAARALQACGPRALPLLASSLADRARPPAVRRRIPRLLARLAGGPEGAAALQSLLDNLDESNGQVRSAVFEAAASIGARLSGQAAQLLRSLREEVRQAYGLHVLQHDLSAGASEPGALFEDALRVRLARALDNALNLLAALNPAHGRALGRARRGLKHAPSSDAGQARRRAAAIELLDTLPLSMGEMKRLLLPLLEAPPERLLALARAEFGLAPQPRSWRLIELAARDSDPWLQSCALFQIGRLGQAELAGHARAQLLAPNPLVRESALAACRRLLPPAEFRQALETQLAAAGPPRLASLARDWWQELEAK
jgi:ATP:ADP antiporter, AAA family